LQQHTKTDDLLRGDQYIFYSFEKNSKLVINFPVGKRDRENALTFLEGLNERVTASFSFQAMALLLTVDTAEAWQKSSADRFRTRFFGGRLARQKWGFLGWCYSDDYSSQWVDWNSDLRSPRGHSGQRGRKPSSSYIGNSAAFKLT